MKCPETSPFVEAHPCQLEAGHAGDCQHHYSDGKRVVRWNLERGIRLNSDYCVRISNVDLSDV